MTRWSCILCGLLLFSNISGCVQSNRQEARDIIARRDEKERQEIAKIEDDRKQREDLSKQAQTADCGPYPKNYQQLIKEGLTRRLKDPNSAQIKYGKPPKKDYHESLTSKQGMFCWSVAVGINAKNSFGGYEGFKTWAFFIRDGKIIDTMAIDYPWSE